MFHVNLELNLIWPVLSAFLELSPLAQFYTVRKFLFQRSQSHKYAGNVFEMEAEEELVAHSAQANEIKYQVVTTEGLEV